MDNEAQRKPASSQRRPWRPGLRSCGLTGLLTCAAFVAFTLLVPPTTAAQEQATRTSARLLQIKSDVDSAEKEILALKAQYADLLKQRKEIEAKVQRLKEDERDLVSRLTSLSRTSDELERSVTAARSIAETKRGQIEKRLRALYMGATPTGDASVLWRAGKSSLERTAVYIRAIRKFDESNFKEVRTAFETVSAKQDELADSIAKERAAQDELRSKREEGEGESSKLKAVMDQINAKKKSAEKALAKLRAEADKLEEVMASLTRGEIPPEEIRPSPQPEETRAAVNVEQPDVGPLRGLFERGVQLVAPVKGSVVQKFGNVRVTNFSDMIFSKGLEFATESDSDVHAIASGKVAYVGNMPGYETVVVLDHGARSYSLYGRLGKALVTSGQLIQKDSVVGSTSAPDDKGRNFYFEVRKNGSPVDPEGVLKRTSR